MKTIDVTDSAFRMVDELRDRKDSELFNLTKCEITDAFATLALMVHEGRDDQDISFWTDRILRVMYVLADYTMWLNELVNDCEDICSKYELNNSCHENM